MPTKLRLAIVRVALLCSCCCASLTARADAVDDLVAARMRRLRVPGLSLAVVRRGRLVKARGYGLARLAPAAPAAPETVYEIGSVTKQFTAAAVMLLVEEGKVNLDDPAAKYLDRKNEGPQLDSPERV